MECTFDHVHLRTPDPEATAAWYERVLGAQVIRSTQQGKPRIDIKLGGQNIFTVAIAPGEKVGAAPISPYAGIDHFGLFVKNIDKVHADLKAKGVEFTKELHSPRPGIRIMFIRGPEGVSIELLERD